MKPETYKELLKDLQKLQKTLVASQISAVRASPALSARMARLHAEAEVGGRIDDFVATSARKSTVLFLLRTVFVRVLEDLGILELKRIRGDWGWDAFRSVAPTLDHRAYFKFIFRDLALDFPALFASGHDELPLPNEDRCVDVWRLWHHPNRNGEHYVWNGDGFDSRFLGDLYQGLDADIRKRYALFQTPFFVEEYILDQTFTPAIKEFDPAHLRSRGELFRVLDPTCGSGHFLVGAFRRLATYWRDEHGLDDYTACARALESVWGCDINPHAVEIAGFRLLLEVVARTGIRDLGRLSHAKANLRALDSLIPWERQLEQLELDHARDRLDAYSTPAHRSENAAFLGKGFHVVVGNPPYIQPKDDLKTADYRAFWPRSAKGHYALSGPFFERCFQLGIMGGYIGFITAKAFINSEYGESLIRHVISRLALRRIVDTSRVTIPWHGTPTLLVFGRNSPRDDSPVEVVTVSRGELRRLKEPEKGVVWKSIAETTSEQPVVGLASLTKIERTQFDRYPWELADPLESEVLEVLKSAPETLEIRASDFGYSFQTNCDDVFLVDAAHARRLGVEGHVRSVCTGEVVRDYGVTGAGEILYPYDGTALMNRLPAVLLRAMWPWKTTLYGRATFSRSDYRSDGRAWFQWHQFSVGKHRTPLSIVFSDVVTHNHFALDRGGRVFSRHSPVIKLRSLEVDDHLDVLGLLGSSVVAFWIRRTFRSKGAQGVGEGIKTEVWEQFVEPDSSKIGRCPVTSANRSTRVSLAHELDRAAVERAANLPAAVLSRSSWLPTTLEIQLTVARASYTQLTKRMVALQEELDWMTYQSYGLIESTQFVGPDEVEPLVPGHRPFEIVLARNEEDVLDEEKSSWWERHGHDRVTEVPDCYSEAHRARLQVRVELIQSNPRLGMLETPTYKRRWEPVAWQKETVLAAETWLLDSLESLFAASRNGAECAPLSAAVPYRLEDIVSAWSRSAAVVAVAGVWNGTGSSVDLALVAEKLLTANALPDNPHRVYTDEGLRKLWEWKRVWALQDQEDVLDTMADVATATGEPLPVMQLVDPDDAGTVLSAIPLPPKFEKPDFVEAEYFAMRGKRNVPRERFILFAELTPPRYGWNGWRDRARALAQAEAFTLAESDPQQPLPVPTTDDPRRCGVTYGLWESLPDVKRWGSADEHAELLSLAQEACRQTRCPCPVVEAWKARVLRGEPVDGEVLVPPPTRGKRKSKTVAVSDDAGVASRPVSLRERAWLASLLEGAKRSFDAAGIWTLHQGRLIQSEAAAAAKRGATLGQLRMPGIDGELDDEKAIDEARLAVVIDDLVASGDLAVTGRGTKKRYKLVPRTARS